jgi:hypothetical protein
MRKIILTAGLFMLTAGQAFLMPAVAESRPATSSTSASTQHAVTPQGDDMQLTIGFTPFAGDPNECGTADDLEVNVGDQVNVCYTMTNNGLDTLAYQSIVDSVDGAILTYEPISIAPGQSYSHVETIVASGDTNRTATWTGYVNLASYTADDAVTPNFIDISATGTDLGFVPGDGFDNEIVEYTTEFPLRFYGQTSTAMCMSIDGLIQFNDPTCIPPSGQNPPPGYSFNQDIPTTYGTEVPTFLAPFWNNMGDGPGRVYVQTLGSAPNRQFIIQWNDLHHYAISTSSATFEVVFEESSDTIRFEYLTTVFGNFADNGAVATVGLQADPNGLYTKYSYNQASLFPDMAIQWNYTAAASTSVESNSAHLDAGIPSIALATDSIAAVAGPGETTTSTLGIGNVGERDLNWSIEEAPGGSRAHFPKILRYAKPAVEGAFPADAGLSLDRYASGSSNVDALPWSPRALAGDAQVPAFGTSTIAGLVGMDATDPTATFTIINPNVDTWYYAVSFIGNDFSKLWVIVADAWEFAPGTYGTIDIVTGEFTEIGHITGGTGYLWTGLTQDPVTGVVYAVNSDDGFNARLYTVDLASGEATLVGDIDGPGVNASRVITGIAISPNGLMYGIDQFGQTLLAIDKQSGAATIIESLGLNIQYFQDLEFDQKSGDLYWSSMYATGTGELVGEMRVLDPATATSTATGTYPPSGEQPTTQVIALAIAQPSTGCAALDEVPWLSVSPASGMIPAGDADQDVIVTMNADGLDSGLYQATICVFSDDPQKPVMAVPVSFAVTDGALYEQNTSDTEYRAFNNTVVAPGSIVDMSSEGADDFTVSDPNGWSVSGFNFSAYGSNGNALPSHVNLRIHADDGNGHPGAEVVCFAPNVASVSFGAPTNQIGVWLPSACQLPPGNYWVVWSFADVDLTTPVLGFWGQTTTQNNQPAVWHNPGGMLSAGCTEWSTFDQCPDQFDATARDFGFSVFGTPGQGDACSDVVFSNGFEGSGACAAQRTAHAY